MSYHTPPAFAVNYRSAIENKVNKCLPAGMKESDDLRDKLNSLWALFKRQERRAADDFRIAANKAIHTGKEFDRLRLIKNYQILNRALNRILNLPIDEEEEFVTETTKSYMKSLEREGSTFSFKSKEESSHSTDGEENTANQTENGTTRRPLKKKSELSWLYLFILMFVLAVFSRLSGGGNQDSVEGTQQVEDNIEKIAVPPVSGNETYKGASKGEDVAKALWGGTNSSSVPNFDPASGAGGESQQHAAGVQTTGFSSLPNGWNASPVPGSAFAPGTPGRSLPSSFQDPKPVQGVSVPPPGWDAKEESSGGAMSD